MVELNWSKNDIYDLLRSNGLKGLLGKEKEIREELNNSVLSDVSRQTGEQSLASMDEEIEKKLKNSGQLYMLYSVETNLPFIQCYDTKDMFVSYVFSDMLDAKKFESKLFANGYRVMIREAVTGKKRQAFFDDLSRKGIRYLNLDPQGVNHFISMREFTPWVEDGYQGLDVKLKNGRLNALLAIYMQDAKAKKLTESFEDLLLNELYHGCFIFPIMENGEVMQGDEKGISVNYMVFQLENNAGVKENIAPFFTDMDFCQVWINNFDDDVSIGFGRFDLLLKMMQDFNVQKFVLNADTFDLEIGKSLVAKILQRHEAEEENA